MCTAAAVDGVGGDIGRHVIGNINVLIAWVDGNGVGLAAGRKWSGGQGCERAGGRVDGVPDRAWSNLDPGIGFPLYDPVILRYKDDPRFVAFCRKVGLPVPGETRQQM